MDTKLLIGSHVGMSGKDMMAGSVREALSYGANTFMIYTGAPQNTRRKPIEELNIEEGQALMKESGIEQFIIHAPYIINLGNSVKEDIFKLGVDFLRTELERSAAMGSRILVLHPGAHVGEGTETGIKKIVEGLNEVLTEESGCLVALETMAGKGSEIGVSFEELAAIYNGVRYNGRLRVCMDTCHMHDAGYPVSENFDSILDKFDRLLGLSQIGAVHINDSKNPQGAHKDRHANIGDGYIGYSALRDIVHHPALASVPKILETPYKPMPENPEKTAAPYKEEIEMLRQ